MTEQPAWVISSATAQRRSGNVRVAAVAAMAAMDWRRSIMGFDSCGLRGGGGSLLLAPAAFEQAADHDEEPGYEEQGQRRAGDHAAQHAGADGALAGRAGTRGDDQRHDAQAKGHRG